MSKTDILGVLKQSLTTYEAFQPNVFFCSFTAEGWS